MHACTYMGKIKEIFTRACALCITMLLSVAMSYALKPAGTTADRATLITDTTELTVQSGGNYVRLNEINLPATITYIADTAFGPIPEAKVLNELVTAKTIFAGCKNGWQWIITLEESAKIVEIRAHENATLLVEPYMCPTDKDIYTTAWDSLKWHDVVYKQDGEYTFDDSNERGCAWTETLHLTIHHTLYDTVPKSGCGSFTYDYNGQTYTENDIYRIDTTMVGDDRQVNFINVTILQPTSGEETKEACSSFKWNGTTYTESGNYTFETTNVAGCDSTATLHLTINLPTSGEETKEACSSYKWNGTEYTESGDYTFHTTNVAGCDSTATLHLTINQPTTGEESHVECGFYKWNGYTYDKSGDYTFHTTNVAGCDSTATLHLTINQPTTGEETQKKCESYEWHGTTYTQSGDYTFKTTNVAGCDSIATLHLTILQPTAGEENITRCLSYTSPRGNTYTVSGDYTEVITNKAGCDSTITIHLTLIGDCTSYDTVYFCRGLNKEHDERINEDLVRRYLEYRYVSPDQTNYMEGVMMEQKPDATLMDLARAEKNLRAYYIGERVPVERVIWSAKYRGESEFVAVTVENQPQWIAAGQIAIQVQFLCGEVYINAFSTGTEGIDAAEMNLAPAKYIENGQVIIIRGGERYTITGLKISK